MNFEKSIFINKKLNNTPFLAAHRGVCGANIPCNTLLAFKIAVEQGADIVEIDVAESADGEYFVFHPGMEFAYLKTGKPLIKMTADEVSNTPILNCDEAKTHYRIPKFAEVLALLKDKVYINIDKFWTDIEGITEQIRIAGVEKQVIIKTPPDEEYLKNVEKFAPDLMFMSVVRQKDEVTQKVLPRNINYIGTEVLFEKPTDEVASPDYIRNMHKSGLLLWVNSIIYDENDVISGEYTDDISLEKGGDFGWGKLQDMGFDIIQTDWLSQAKKYFKKENSGN